MSTPTFSKQEAEALIAVAQEAPLRNLRAASELSTLLSRFKAWYEHVASEKPPRKSRQETPAGQPQDPTS